MKRNLAIAALISMFIVSAASAATEDSVCYTPSGRAVDCSVLKEAKRIWALKQLTKRNKELKAELSRYNRKAQLLAAAKNEELPKTAQLAPSTTVKVPAATTAAATPTVKTEVAADEQSAFERNFASAFENGTSQSFKTPSDPLYNNLKMILKYNLTDHFNVKAEPSVGWKWNHNTDPNSSFTLNDLPLVLNITSIYSNPTNGADIGMSFVLSLPTSQSSRDNGVISYIIANTAMKINIDGDDGNLTFTPELLYVARKYSTAAPKATDQSSFNNLDPTKQFAAAGGDTAYEILDPYNQFMIDVNTSVWHRIVGPLSFSTWVKFYFTRMYGDYVLANGILQTITPESWINTMEFSQELKYEVTNKVSIKLGLASVGKISGYKPFNTNGDNNLICWLTLKYDFFNKTDF